MLIDRPVPRVMFSRFVRRVMPDAGAVLRSLRTALLLAKNGPPKPGRDFPTGSPGAPPGSPVVAPACASSRAVSYAPQPEFCRKRERLKFHREMTRTASAIAPFYMPD
jgi:hypothetical protein